MRCLCDKKKTRIEITGNKNINVLAVKINQTEFNICYNLSLEKMGANAINKSTYDIYISFFDPVYKLA